MITNQGPKVLEYNVRFGDPECQPMLMRLESDLVDLLEATVDGRLDEIEPLRLDPRPAVCVVMASEGYPGSYERGFPIRGLEEAAKLPDVKVFHAGTATVDGQVVTNGGRVLARHRVGLVDSQPPSCKPTRRSSASAGKAPGAARTSRTGQWARRGERQASGLGLRAGG